MESFGINGWRGSEVFLLLSKMCELLEDVRVEGVTNPEVRQQRDGTVSMSFLVSRISHDSLNRIRERFGRVEVNVEALNKYSMKVILHGTEELFRRLKGNSRQAYSNR